MTKWIIKLLMPSPENLAKIAVEELAKAIEKSNKQDSIAKYANIAEKCSEVQQQLAKLLNDGKIDETEKLMLLQKITPIFQKLLERL